MESFQRKYVSQRRTNTADSINEVKHEILDCYLKVCLLLGKHLLTTKQEDSHLKEITKRLDVVLYLINEYIDLCDSSKNSGINEFLYSEH